MSTGAEWLLKLDANTKGAADVIAALGKTETAADQAERMIDRALSRMDRAPKALKDAFATAKANAAQERASQQEAKRAFREAQDIKLRTLQASQQLVEMEGHHAKAAESTWKEMFKGELAAHALEKGVELAYEGVKKIGEVMLDAFKLSAKSERGGRVFENILGSKEEKAEVIEYLEKFSGLSEFTDDALKGVSAELLRVGLRGADYRNALGAIVDVAAEAPDKMEGMSEAANAFSRIQLTGRVDSRILRGLRLNPHDVEKQLAEDLKLTPATIKKRLEEGTIKGTEAMGSIFTVMERKTGKQLGEVGLGMADLVTAKLEKIADIPEEIFKSMKNTEGFKSISESLGGILEAFGPESATAQGIRDGMSQLFDAVGKTIKEINWKEVGDTIAYMVSATKDWIEPLTKVLGVMEKLVGAVVSLPKMGNAIGDWFARTLNPEIDQESMMDKERRENAQRKLERLNEAAWNDPEVKALAKQSGVDLAGAQLEGAREKTDTHSPSKVWAKFGRDQAEGLALGMESSVPRVAVATDSMVPVPSLGSMGGASAGMGGFNAGGISIPMTFHVGGSGASADDIAREVSALVPSALLSALEQFAIQGGVA